MAQYYFSLNVDYDTCRKLYESGNNSVVLTSDSGQRVQLPALNLRRFLDREGIRGRFRLITDENNKVKSFEKIR